MSAAAAAPAVATAAIRRAAELIAVDADNCEVLVGAAVDVLESRRRDLLAPAADIGGDPQTFRRATALLAVAREKATAAKDRADELAMAGLAGPTAQVPA